MKSRMEVKVTKANKVAVLSPQGELDLSSSRALEKAIGEEMAKGRKDIVVDFNGVPFIDTSGIGTLITSLICLKDKRGNLKLSSLEPQVRKTLQMAGLTKIFEIYKTKEEALRSFQAPP